MKTIFSKVKLRSGQIVQLFLLVLLSAVGQMLLPSFLAQMISHGVAEGENRIVWMYAVIMAGVTLFSCVISFLSVKIASYISTDFAAQLRTQVFSKVQEFSAAEMDRFGTASLVTRSTSDITNVQNFLTLLLRVGLLAPMMAAAGLVFSAATGGEVSSVLLVAIPVLLTVLTIIMVLASKYSIRLRKKLDQINRLFLESLEGVRVIRAFNKQKTENARFEEANEDYAMTADHKPSDARYQCDLRSDDGGCIGHGRILCKYRRYGSRFFSGKQPVYQYGTYICDDAVSCHYDVSYKLCMCETNRGSFADRQLDTGWKVSDGKSSGARNG
mgnify:CR=1 FL=1